MDIIAYGAASKEKRRAEELAALLGPDVKGGKENLQGRLDTLMDSMDDATRLADRVIVRDAVNLMKAEARLNTVVQAKKYGMDHMVFDDLLDLSGIDTLNSTGYTHDAVKGEIVLTNGSIQSKATTDLASIIIPVVESDAPMQLSIIVDGDDSKKQIIESEKKNYIEQALQEGANFALRIEGSGIVTSIGLIWT